MQINRWLNLSRIMGNFPLHRLVQKKNRPKKFLLMATNNWNVLDAWSVKYFFAPNFPISQKDWTKRIQAVAKRYAFHSNVICIYSKPTNCNREI